MSLKVQLTTEVRRVESLRCSDGLTQMSKLSARCLAKVAGWESRFSLLKSQCCPTNGLNRENLILGGSIINQSPTNSTVVMELVLSSVL